MKRTLIFVALIVIGLGVYFAHSYLARKAAEELDAILGPKFKEAGASYGELEVTPISGTITLKNIAIDDEDVSIGEISVRSTLEDLLAAAEGTPEFLHGLHVTVQDVAIADDDAVVNLGSGEAHIDALIDIRALQDDPEKWMVDLMQQEDVTLNLSGQDWIIRSEDLGFALGDASMSFSGAVPREALLEEDYEEFLTELPEMQWSVRVSDYVLEGEELRREGFPESRLVLETLEYDFDANAERLTTTLDFQSNLGNGSMDIDLDIQSIDPPIMDFGTFEVEFSGLHPEFRRALREVPLPLEPRGEDGYRFSYTGPLMGLSGMGM